MKRPPMVLDDESSGMVLKRLVNDDKKDFCIHSAKLTHFQMAGLELNMYVFWSKCLKKHPLKILSSLLDIS